MVDRILEWFRGLVSPSDRDRSMASGERVQDSPKQRDTGPSDPGEGVVLGDLADSEPHVDPQADVSRQTGSTGPTGASTDEFVSGGYTGDPVDQEDVEEAAESEGDPTEDIGDSGRSDLDDTSGDDDAETSGIPVGTADIDEANSVHDAVGRHRTDDDTSELDEGLVDRSGVVDRSMEGDTDYVVSGYPSESIDDIDIKDTDDIGAYDADSVDGVDEDDDADLSGDPGDLGLSDSESVDDRSSPSGSDASGFTPASPDDVGVGVAAEVDDTDLIGDSDDATDPSLQGTSDVSGQGGQGEDNVGEGMQSFASTADRDVLADMQDTAATADSTGSRQDVEGLGSDPSAADDPTSVGLPSAAEEAIVESASTTDSAGDGAGVSDSPVPAQPDDSAETASAAGVTASGSSGGQTHAGAIRGDGTNVCPADYPIKGNASSKIYHTPGRASYEATVPEWCFATEEDAVNAGYRAPKR